MLIGYGLNCPRNWGLVDLLFSNLKMSIFLTIPLEDILRFLKENQIEKSRITKAKKPETTEAIYDKAWKLIRAGGDLVISSLAIEDFILAYNAQGNLSQTYQTSTLLVSSDEQLRDLSNLLGLSMVRRDRLIRILGYLGLLVNDISTFDTLPKDALWLIGTNLDCRTIATFRLISKRFAELFDEKGITDMLRASLHRTTSRNLIGSSRKDLDILCSFEQNKGRLACGTDFFLAIFDPNKVCSWGQSFRGQLGHGQIRGRAIKKPKVIVGLKNIKMVAAGEHHSLVLDFQGRVYSWGANNFGQLGLGHYDDLPIPTLIPSLENITAIFAGYNSSIILDDKGKTYQFGTIYRDLPPQGALMLRVYDQTAIPELIELNGVISASISLTHVLFLTNEGLVYGMGSNYGKALGLLDDRVYPLTLIQNLEKIIAVMAIRSYSLFLNTEGEILVLGARTIESQFNEMTQTVIPTKMTNLSRVITMSLASSYNIILDHQGRLHHLIRQSATDKEELERLMEHPNLRNIIAFAHYPGNVALVINQQGDLIQSSPNTSVVVGKLEVY
jgi:alpha-tubulin suppressor-like RCC1 family protein